MRLPIESIFLDNLYIETQYPATFKGIRTIFDLSKFRNTTLSPNFCFHNFLTISNQKKHTSICQLSTIKIHERRKSKFLNRYIISCYPEKFTRTKTNILRRFITGNVYIFSPYGNTRAPRAIFHRRLFILSRVLRPDKFEEAFQNRIKTEVFSF